ncbi:hypothetical protein V7S79_09390 [Aquirufa sp. ROCK-SH2]
MRLIKYLHLISLDVVVGAILYQLFGSHFICHTIPPNSHILALLLAIWLIYLVDRRIDLKKNIPQDERHFFQYQHQKFINAIILILIVLSIINLFFLPLYLIKIGVAILIGVVFYWFIWWRGLFKYVLGSKEFFTAFFYTLGISASILFKTGINEDFCLFFVLLYLCVFQNLVLFSSLEDEKTKNWNFILIGIELIFLSIIGWVFFENVEIHTIDLIIPFVITFCLQVWIHYFAYSIQQRWVGELAFFSPIIYFIYEFFSK